MDEGELTLQLAGLVSAGDDRGQRARGVAAAIRRFGDYRWVGIYDVTEDEIAVVGWDGPGPPAHPRFPRTHGLCGAAVAAGETVVVGDVSADPRYLTTHATTRSEIVVPVKYEGRVVAEIDVDSDEPAAFGDEDCRFLERVATLISPYCLVGWDTGGEDWAP